MTLGKIHDRKAEVNPLRLEVYKTGIKANSKAWRKVFPCKPPKIAKRGKVRGFSFKSRARLRETILTKDIEGHELHGLCLTLPGGQMPENHIELFRKAFDAWRHRFARKHPTAGAVWRVELQQRKAPHLHLLVWLSPSDKVSGFLARSEIARDWCYCVMAAGWPFDGSDGVSNFIEHGTLWSEVATRASALRYLCDHASKHKQAQLGWQGRQWGVISAPNFRKLSPDRELDGLAAILAARVWSRLRRYKVSDPRLPFGWRHSPARPCQQGISYASPGTVARIASWAVTEAARRQGLHS